MDGKLVCVVFFKPIFYLVSPSAKAMLFRGPDTKPMPLYDL